MVKTSLNFRQKSWNDLPVVHGNFEERTKLIQLRIALAPKLRVTEGCGGSVVNYPNQHNGDSFVFLVRLMLVVSIFVHYSSQAASASSREPTPVQPLRIEPNGKASETTLKNGTIWVRTTLHRDQSSLVQLRFRGGKTFLASFLPNGVIQRFWMMGVLDHQRMITRREQIYLKSLLDQQGAQLQAQYSATFRFLKFAADFLPPNEIIEPYEDLKISTPFAPKMWEMSWTPLCDYLGKRTQAVFSVGNNNLNVRAVVGSPRSGCRGRCGTQCEQWGQHRKNQYTQECFDHDACRDITGTNLGECSDEFWAAAPGYTWAEDCF